MIAWLVYEKNNTKRNHRFIAHWIKLGKQLGIKFKLILIEQLRYGVRNNNLFLQVNGVDSKPDFAVMRLNAPLLSEFLEKIGIPIFNNAHVARICNDKRLTHMELNGIVPMMDTAFVDISSEKSPFPYPVVVKASNSCGGRKVFLCNNETAYISSLKECYPDTAVVQPLSDTIGKDVRVYILGNKILKSMMRYSTDGDFRSNIGQGGNAMPYKIDSETENNVMKILSRFNFDFVGVDFIFHNGRLLFNEIEDAVGTRMLYSHTDIDPVKCYLDHIIKSL